MSDNINMDTKKNPSSNVPQLEFAIPKSEIQADLETGQVGSICIPCEVISYDDKRVYFRKRKLVSIETQFRQRSLSEMEDDIGVEER